MFQRRGAFSGFLSFPFINLFPKALPQPDISNEAFISTVRQCNDRNE